MDRPFTKYQQERKPKHIVSATCATVGKVHKKYKNVDVDRYSNIRYNLPCVSRIAGASAVTTVRLKEIVYF